MRHRLFERFRMLTGTLVLTVPLSCSGAGDWEQAQVADALHAAPSSVTHQAKIYAWQPFGQLILVRDGPSPYTCVASGSSSLRFAKPPLPLRSGETEGKSAPDQASVEAHGGQTNSVRIDQRDERSAVHMTRRGVFGRLAGAAGGLVRGRVGQVGAAVADVPSYPVPADPTKVLGRGVSPYGFRSQFETAVRWLFPTPVHERGGSMTPLHEAQGIITPSSLHYELHHGGVPTIDPSIRLYPPGVAL